MALSTAYTDHNSQYALHVGLPYWASFWQICDNRLCNRTALGLLWDRLWVNISTAKLCSRQNCPKLSYLCQLSGEYQTIRRYLVMSGSFVTKSDGVIRKTYQLRNGQKCYLLPNRFQNGNGKNVVLCLNFCSISATMQH